MGLQEQQNFLARLYTDPELLAAFVSDPQHVAGTRGGLSQFDIEAIAPISLKEVGAFAESLFWKRFHEVEKVLPITARLLAHDFETLFREFSATYNPNSITKHLDDAIEFARYLRRSPTIAVHVRDAARLEGSRLTFFHRDRRIGFVLLRHDVRLPVPIRRWRAAVWFRFRGRVYRLGG